MAMSVVYTVVDGVMWQEDRGGTITQYVPDTLGSVVAEMDEAGQITHTADYWPYGEVRSETGTKKSPFGFVGVLGYMKDFADALYVRARYLRTKLARWQTVDPLRQSWQYFTYAAMQPTSLIDRSGLTPINVADDEEGEIAGRIDGDKCKVWRCSQYGFGPPVMTHQYICVTSPSGGCAGGFTSKNEVPFGEGDWADQLNPCPPYHAFGNTECKLISTSCRYADAVCKCIFASRLRDAPTYILSHYNCAHYVHQMLKCGCRQLGLIERFKVGYCRPRIGISPIRSAREFLESFVGPPQS